MIFSIIADTAPISPQLWMVYALGLLTIVYAVFLRPQMRRNKDPLAKSPFQNRGNLARQREIEKQMETLLVELAEMARQITAQLDTRSAKLEALMAEADAKIAALTTARSQATGIEPPTPAAAGRDIAIGMPDDPRHSAIYDLADSGLSAGQIAQRLSRPSGEVELILALRSRK